MSESLHAKTWSAPSNVVCYSSHQDNLQRKARIHNQTTFTGLEYCLFSLTND